MHARSNGGSRSPYRLTPGQIKPYPGWHERDLRRPPAQWPSGLFSFQVFNVEHLNPEDDMSQTRVFRKARSVNSTSTAFPATAPTRTEPTGDAGTAAGRCVIDLAARGDGYVPCDVMILPYGLGSANDVFSLRLLGWRKIGTGLTALWVPVTLAELACTLGAMTGVAASEVLATELFCDTITIVSEPTTTADVTRVGSVLVSSPANDTVAWAKVPLLGVQKIEFLWDQTTNTPAANALIAMGGDEE